MVSSEKSLPELLTAALVEAHIIHDAGSQFGKDLVDLFLKCCSEVEKEESRRLKEVEAFLDMLFEEPNLSKLFRTDLINIRCSICDVTECSTRHDRYECLRLNKPKPTVEGT